MRYIAQVELSNVRGWWSLCSWTIIVDRRYLANWLRLVGKAKALDMILFSTRINPQQALEAGLANQLAAPAKLIDTALEFADKLVKRPPLAVGCVLKALSAGEYEGFEKGLEVEEEGSAVVGASKDRIEGFTAFLEKREPKFTGE